jgi:PKD repeat protein
VINLIGKTGIGPHTVHVHALASSLNGGSYLTARYEWDFGDDEGQYNELVGWNAAHLYENAGTYTIKLKITNEDGKSNTLSTQVTVVEDKRRTIYVDAVAGRDTNSGLSEGAAVKTSERARQLLGSNTKLLFKRDQRHVIDESITVPFHNVLVGAYGSGDRPLLWRAKGGGTSTISTYDKSNQVVIQDLMFDSPGAVKGNIAGRVYADGIYARGVNITIRGCEFLNLDDAINANGDPRGLLVQNNTAPLATGLRAYFVWSEGSDQVFLGNESANSTREHNLRSSGTRRMLIAFNKFTNLDRSDVDPLDYSKGTVEVHKGSFAYVMNNELHDGALRAGPRGNTYEPASMITEWTVFDGNELFEHDLTIKVGTHHFMARNNIIRSNSSQAITIDVSDKWGRTVSDIHIVNNTGYTTLDKGRFLLLPVSGGNKGAITLKNNMWVTKNYHAGANGSAPIFVYGKNLDMFKEISNNVWPKPAAFHKYGQGGIHYLWTNSSDSRGYLDYKEWDAFSMVSDERYDNSALDGSLRPKSGTVAATAGEAVAGVFTDFYGRTRPLNGKVSAGAVQA